MVINMDMIDIMEIDALRRYRNELRNYIADGVFDERDIELKELHSLYNKPEPNTSYERR
jgi:hypothetical protein